MFGNIHFLRYPAWGPQTSPRKHAWGHAKMTPNFFAPGKNRCSTIWWVSVPIFRTLLKSEVFLHQDPPLPGKSKSLVWKKYNYFALDNQEIMEFNGQELENSTRNQLLVYMNKNTPVMGWFFLTPKLIIFGGIMIKETKFLKLLLKECRGGIIWYDKIF